jgi:hypothetical protein
MTLGADVPSDFPEEGEGLLPHAVTRTMMQMIQTAFIPSRPPSD